MNKIVTVIGTYKKEIGGLLRHAATIAGGVLIAKGSLTTDTFTIIRVEARDHMGMLYKIASVFADFGILIHRAKISTQGDRGIDVFYVSLKDQRVPFNKLMSQFKANMIKILMIERLEDVP